MKTKNSYVSKTVCDVCGCEGVATIKTQNASWLVGVTIQHTDPRICEENLKNKSIPKN
jgi:hypothetical protein